MNSLHDQIDRKFTESYDVSDWEIMTDSGWKDVTRINKTVPYEVFELKTENHALKCADDHIVFDSEMNERFVKDLRPGDVVKTDTGDEAVVSAESLGFSDEMYDIELSEDSDHRYYADGILSHNSTTYSIYLLWQGMFFPDNKIAIAAHQFSTAEEILSRIKLAYEYLPKEIKPAVVTYNNKQVEFDNNSEIRAFATGGNSLAGFSCVSGDTMVTIEDYFGDIHHIRIDMVDKIANGRGGTKVLTESGFRQFYGIRKQENRECLTIITDKEVLTCTPDHRVKLDNHEFIRADELAPEMALSNSSKVVGVAKDSEKHTVYDLLDVEGGHEYLTNGITSHNCDIIALDEAALWAPSVSETFFTTTMPIISSRKNSKAIMVSTPRGTVNNRFYDIWTQANSNEQGLKNRDGWVPFRIDWWDVPGRDEEWKKARIAEMGLEGFRREYGCEFTSSGATLLVPDDCIQRFRQTLDKYPVPAEVDLADEGSAARIVARVWKNYDPNKTYAAAIDPGEGTGNDASVLYIYDISEPRSEMRGGQEGRTGGISVDAVVSCTNVGLVEFAGACARMLRQWNWPAIICENNGVGSGFIEVLMNTFDVPSDRVFSERKSDGTVRYGIHSMNASKLEACMFARELLTTSEVNFSVPDKMLVDEMGTFVRKATASSITYCASGGSHDDHMMAFVWGMYLLHYKNIDRYFIVDEVFKTSQGQALPGRISMPSCIEDPAELMKTALWKVIDAQLNGIRPETAAVDMPVAEDADEDLYYGSAGRGRSGGSKRPFVVLNQSYSRLDSPFENDDWEEDLW